MELPSEVTSVDVSNVFGSYTELFGHCFPVYHSLMSSILPSLVVACMPINSLLFEDTCTISADSIIGEKNIENGIAVPLETSIVERIEWTSLSAVTSVKDALVEVEVVSQVTNEGRVFLVTIEYGSTNSTTEVKVEVPHRLMEDP